jgi:hypothetical protein
MGDSIVNIQSICKVLGDNGCLAFIYLWCADLPESMLIADFNKLIGKGILDKDCTVLDADRLLAHFGVRAKISKMFAPPADKKYAARWRYGAFVHWVGMCNKDIKENTLDISQCVLKGHIDTDNPYDPPYRIIDMEG